MQKRLVLLNPKFVQQQQQKRIGTAPAEPTSQQDRPELGEEAQVNQSADGAGGGNATGGDEAGQPSDNQQQV